MLSAKEIAVGLVTQAKMLRRKDAKSQDAKRLLNMAGRIMGTYLTGRRQR